MRMAIVDDVAAEQEIIKKYIGEWVEAKKEIIEFRCFAGSEEFLFAWEDDKAYDLLVLDIEMGEMNGLALAEKVRAEDKAIPILFVTGYDEYMQYGYDVAALHYLLKPVEKERLFQVLDRFAAGRQEETRCLLLSGADTVRRIQTTEMLYVEAAGHGSVLHTRDEILPVRESIGAIERQVADISEIVKCHRAFIVNLRFAAAIQNTDLVLDNGVRLPIARKQMKNVQQAFLRYYKR